MPEKKNGAVRVLGRVLRYALIAVMAAAVAVYICGVMSYDAAIEVFCRRGICRLCFVHVGGQGKSQTA